MGEIPYNIKRKLKGKKGYVGIDNENNLFVHINNQFLTLDVKKTIQKELNSNSIVFFKIDN